MAKERWAWPCHSTPTDRPAVERDSRDTGNKVFLLVGPSIQDQTSWRTTILPISLACRANISSTGPAAGSESSSYMINQE